MKLVLLASHRPTEIDQVLMFVPDTATNLEVVDNVKEQGTLDDPYVVRVIEDLDEDYRIDVWRTFVG